MATLRTPFSLGWSKRWKDVKRTCALSVVLLLVGQACAQAIYEPYSFATLTGQSSSQFGPGPLMEGYIAAMAMDRADNIYYNSSLLLLKRSPSGFVSTLAGGNPLAGADGTGVLAGFNSITMIAAAGNGTVYVIDAGNLRSVSANGTVTTLVVNLAPPVRYGEFSSPPAYSLAADAEGNAYFSDGSSTIKKISPTGAVSPVLDSSGAAHAFQGPNALAFDADDNLLVYEAYAGVITRVSPAGVTSTAVTLEGSAPLSVVIMAVDLYGDIFVDNDAAVGLQEYKPDGTAHSAAPNASQFMLNGGLGIDSSGNLYTLLSFSAGPNQLIRVDPLQDVTPLATSIFPDPLLFGPAAQVFSSGYSGVTVDTAGNVYFLGSYGTTVQKISPTGFVSTLAGSAATHGSQDGPGGTATFDSASSLAVDSSGNLYVADAGNDTVRKVTPDGTVSTVAGSAGVWGSADGQGSAARFHRPQGIAVDGSGNLYVADTGNDTVRMISQGGTVTTLAGTAGVAGGADGNGFTQPTGIAVDGHGTVYVADTGANAVSEISPSGVVTPLVASGSGGYADGSAQMSAFNQPNAVAVDAKGNVYVTEIGNATVRKITPQGFTTTLAGVSSTAPTTESDGAGAAVGFNSPNAVAVDGAGNVYVCDADTVRVGAATGYPNKATKPILNWALVPVYLVENDSHTLSVAPVTALTTTYQWYVDGTAIPGATGPSLSLSQVLPTQSGYYDCVGSNALGTTTTEFAVSVVGSPLQGRLTNLSCRAMAGSGATQLILGYVIAGVGTSGPAPMLLRAAGPALADVGISGYLKNPQITLYDGTTSIAFDNSSWGTPQIEALAQAVGAFDATASTQGAALYETQYSGAYTAEVTDASGETGIALAEVYDATAATDPSPPAPRLINASARAFVGTGNNGVIVGFVVGGNTPLKVLLRASGPALAPLGVPGYLPDPQLLLFQSTKGVTTLVASNSGWGANPQIEDAIAQTSAFSWGSSPTSDAALVLTLPPGVYTAEVLGVSGDTGIALMEVYEVQVRIWGL